MSEPRILIGESGKKYRDTDAFVEWCKLVADRTNKLTFGNFTQAAGVAYNHDMSDPKGYEAARKMGRLNSLKFRDLTKDSLESKGLTFGMWLDMLIAKAARSNSLDPWKQLGVMAGFMEPETQDGSPSAITNVIIVSKEEVREHVNKSGISGLPKEELARLFGRGRSDSAGGGEIPLVALDQRQSGSDDSDNQDLSGS